MKCPNCQAVNPSDSQFCNRCGTQILRAPDVSSSRTRTMTPPPGDLATGTTFAGRYRVIEEIGKGGMGRVYKVYDKETEEKVALKLLQPEIASSEDVIRRFRDELRLARKIIHKNVCRMYDLASDQGHYYISMEFIDGESLKSFIRQSGQLTVGKAISIASQVCEGLAEAHRLGVIHRDLKPHNVMIDREGNARIMDFGIARSLKAKGITGAGEMIGTPEYMSPEQADGEDADQRADIYALGVMLFEMLTGRLPFPGDAPVSLAAKHLTTAVPDPRLLNPQIPEKLNRLILKCLEKKRENRYSSAEELLTELRMIEKDLPATVHSGRKAGRKIGALKMLPRPWAAALGIVAVLAVISGGFFLIRALISGAGEASWGASIAVLPMKIAGQDEAVLGEGMTSDIIRKLSSIDDLKVIAQTSVDEYKDTIKSAPEIGSELNVENVLQGELKVADDIVTVNIKVIEAGSGMAWPPLSYERRLGRWFQVEDEIVADLASRLKLRLPPDRLRALKKKEPADLEAYKAYQSGKISEKKYRTSGEDTDFEEGIRNYRKALEFEPNYILAQWGLGCLYEARYVALDNPESSDLTDHDLMDKAFQKVHELDPESAEANLGLGWTYFYRENNDESYRCFRDALKIEPNNSLVNFDVGAFLRSIGLYGKAVKFYLKAAKLDPRSTGSYIHAANCYSYMGNFEKAAEVLLQVRKIEPNSASLHLSFARLFLMMKRVVEAEIEINRAEKLAPEAGSVRRHKAWLHAAKGEKEKALALIRPEDKAVRYDMTSIYAALGMKDQAIGNIRAGIEKGFQDLKDYLYSYPFLKSNAYYDGLRRDPRFQEILRQEKKKYDGKLKKYRGLRPLFF